MIQCICPHMSLTLTHPCLKIIAMIWTHPWNLHPSFLLLLLALWSSPMWQAPSSADHEFWQLAAATHPHLWNVPMLHLCHLIRNNSIKFEFLELLVPASSFSIFCIWFSLYHATKARFGHHGLSLLLCNAIAAIFFDSLLCSSLSDFSLIFVSFDLLFSISTQVKSLK